MTKVFIEQPQLLRVCYTPSSICVQARRRTMSAPHTGAGIGARQPSTLMGPTPAGRIAMTLSVPMKARGGVKVRRKLDTQIG